MKFFLFIDKIVVNPFQSFDVDNSAAPPNQVVPKKNQKYIKEIPEPIPALPAVPIQSKSIVGYNRWVVWEFCPQEGAWEIPVTKWSDPGDALCFTLLKNR